MAKRRKGKSKRPSIASQHGITKRSYEKLKREAENTRKRIKNISRANSDNKFLPLTSDYTLNSLLARVDAGERVSDIIKQMSNIRFENFTNESQPAYRTSYGYYISNKDRDRLIKAINTANRNIEKAIKKFGDSYDFMPNKFDPDKVLNEISSDNALKNKIGGLKNFTQKKLTPKEIEGVFTTQAEYDYLTGILNRENARREKERTKEPPTEGFLKMQQDYDKMPIKIEKLQDLQALRRKANQWDDPALVDRANRYITNYKSALDSAETAFIDAGIGGSEVIKKFNKIRSYLDKLTNNVDLITIASNNSPFIDIAIVSGLAMGDTDFYELYAYWEEFSKQYL